MCLLFVLFSTPGCIDFLSSARLLYWKKTPNRRDIVRSDVFVCFFGLRLGIRLFLYNKVLVFRVCWLAVFNLPLPVFFAFFSEGSRTVGVLPFRVCWAAVSNLPVPVPFAFYTDGSRAVVVLYLRDTSFDSSLHHYRFRLPTQRRRPNCCGIVPSGLFALLSST